jgi:hypothetical protein
MIEHYTVCFVKLPSNDDNTICFEATSNVAFRPERLICASGLLLSWWQSLLIRYFRWFCLPWLHRETYEPIDEMTEDELDTAFHGEESIEEIKVRWRFRWIRPITSLVYNMQNRAERKALAGCVVKSICVNNMEILVGYTPITMFYPNMSSMGFVSMPMPTVQPGRTIRIETSATNAQLMFSMIGNRSV